MILKLIFLICDLYYTRWLRYTEVIKNDFIKYMTALEACFFLLFSVSHKQFFEVKNSSYRYKFQEVMPKTLGFKCILGHWPIWKTVGHKNHSYTTMISIKAFLYFFAFFGKGLNTKHFSLKCFVFTF